MNAAKTKIKDWFLITRIRILNFIGEHKYVSAAIGIFLLSLIIFLVVRAATDETITNATARVDSLTVSTEGEQNDIAPNFTKVTYTLHFTLSDQNNCTTEGTIYQSDEVTITATLPDDINTNDVKWLGADENASSEISEDGKTLTVKISPVNVCSSQSQLFTLSILNANKDTSIKPTITIQGGSNSSVTSVNDVQNITTTYDKEYSLTPVVKPGVAKKISDNGDRDALFGLMLGVQIDSDEDTISLKGAHLSTSADLTLVAKRTSDNKSLTLYTKNNNIFNNNNFDGNYFGIYNSSRHYFASNVLPDLTSTSGAITAFDRIPSSEASYGIKDDQSALSAITLVSSSNVEIEKYPDSSDATYREELDDSRLTLGSASIPETTETVYVEDSVKEDNEIRLNEIGDYEIRYSPLNINAISMVKKVSIVEPQNENYSLSGTKTEYVTAGEGYEDPGLFSNETGDLAKLETDYTVRYLKGEQEVNLDDLIDEPGEYQEEYTIVGTDEKIIRNINVVESIPTTTSDNISVKTGNIYEDEEFSDHSITIGDDTVVCNDSVDCSYKLSDDGKSEVYTVDKRDSKGYIATITKNINVIPYQYKLSINNIIPSTYVNKISNDFYAIGSYYVTVNSPKDESSSDDFNVNLLAMLSDKSSSASVENKEHANGYDTTSLTSSMYVNENSETVLVDSSEKNGLYGNYYTAAMGEEVTLSSKFEYGFDADDNISQLDINIPVDNNLIPIAYSENVSPNSYFYLKATYNDSVIDALPDYTIQYCDASNTCKAPEGFNRDEDVIKNIKITIKPNEDESFVIRPGTLIEIGTKYEVKTYSATSDVAGNLNNLKFSESATFSWINNGETLTKESNTPDVYITPYKSRATVNIGSGNDYSSSDVVILDASKNDNYTVFTTLDVVSPAMNIHSNIFGYNRLENFTVRFELPQGINYVYNNNYEMTPDITYNNGNTILTYTYTSIEPNSWIEPIYFDFNVDVASVTGDFQIRVSSGDISGNDYSINNDVSSIDKYKTETKDIRIENTEPVSYGQYVYSNDIYVSNINKDDSFDFSTKLYNNEIPSGNTVTDVDVYTVLPYTDKVNGSSFNGTIQLGELPENAMCTSSDPSMITSENLKDNVEWQSCDDFKSSDGKYSNLTAFKVHYDSLAPKTSAVNTIKVYTTGNEPEDVYTFKSYLEYKNANGTDSGYKNFKDIKLEVISKQITGVVWEDFNVDGIMDDDEKKIDAVTLNLYDSNDNLLDSTTPDKDGVYRFSGLNEGDYYIVAEFNTEKYGATGMPSEDFYDKSRLSAFKEVPIEDTDSSLTEDEDQTTDDKETTDEDESDNQDDDSESQEEPEIMSIIKTDPITVNSETRIIRNINLGLSLRKVFELKVNKYITRAEVTNALGVVTTKEYGNVKLAKLDVKDINNLKIKVVYTIEIQNVKYYPGYATLITEEVPDGMSFNPDYEENAGWVLNEDGTLSNTTLSDELIYENEKKYLTVAFDITRKEAGSFVNFVSVDDLQILGGDEDE